MMENYEDLCLMENYKDLCLYARMNTKNIKATEVTLKVVKSFFEMADKDLWKLASVEKIKEQSADWQAKITRELRLATGCANAEFKSIVAHYEHELPIQDLGDFFKVYWEDHKINLTGTVWEELAKEKCAQAILEKKWSLWYHLWHALGGGLKLVVRASFHNHLNPIAARSLWNNIFYGIFLYVGLAMAGEVKAVIRMHPLMKRMLTMPVAYKDPAEPVWFMLVDW